MYDAVIKHDGRRVAFDAERYAASIAAAARESLSESAAQRLGEDLLDTVSGSAFDQAQHVIRTADLRAFTVKTLRETNFETVAATYLQYARDTAAILQGIRITDPEIPRGENAGAAWDRRRLAESMRASGIALDLAGATAREIERQLTALGLDFVSPALIHALTMLALPPDAFGARAYSIRRVSYSASSPISQGSSDEAEPHALPSSGPALEQFWIQGVHSPDVVEAVRGNLLSLDPCPPFAEKLAMGLAATPHDPVSPAFEAALIRCFEGLQQGVIARAETPAAIASIATLLARISSEMLEPPASRTELGIVFKSSAMSHFDSKQRYWPVTINAGGLVAREALRDPKKAADRLAELAGLAARVHRERAEYFLQSPVRGPILPIAVAGLWNATTWIQGEGFDTTRAGIGARQVILPLCQTLRTAVEALRTESGMELVLTAAAPIPAERRLWHNDRSFFLNDGLKLNAASAYETGLELKLASSMNDFINRLDFAKAVSEAFDEPPIMTIEAGLSSEIDAAQWNDLFSGIAQTGVARLRIVFSGHARTVPNLTRSIRSYLIGFPLLDSLESSTVAPQN